LLGAVALEHVMDAGAAAGLGSRRNSTASPVCRAQGRDEGSVVTTQDPPSEHPHPPGADNDPTGQPGTGTAASAAGRTPEGSTLKAASELLGLTVERPALGVCLATVDGELDMFTAPLLEACLGEQLSTNPSHLIVDLQPVFFLGSSGLNCLLQVRESAQNTATQLHLAGLVTRAVAHPLQVSQVLELFRTYPTVTQALTAILH
jgi:anti-sigma B factor antagonist